MNDTRADGIPDDCDDRGRRSVARWRPAGGRTSASVPGSIWLAFIIFPLVDAVREREGPSSATAWLIVGAGVFAGAYAWLIYQWRVNAGRPTRLRTGAVRRAACGGDGADGGRRVSAGDSCSPTAPPCLRWSSRRRSASTESWLCVVFAGVASLVGGADRGHRDRLRRQQRRDRAADAADARPAAPQPGALARARRAGAPRRGARSASGSPAICTTCSATPVRDRAEGRAGRPPAA